MECDVRTFKLLRARIPTHLAPIRSAYLDSLFGTRKFLLEENIKALAQPIVRYIPREGGPDHLLPLRQELRSDPDYLIVFKYYLSSHTVARSWLR